MEKTEVITTSSHTDTLVVLLHAYTLSPDSLLTIAAVITEELPGAHLIKPPLPMGRFSFEDPTDIARHLVLLIDQEWEQHRSCYGRDYKKIILAGHNVGGLLARKVYLFARGQNPDAPFEGDNGIRFAKPRVWVDSIQRIILLAGMNRGWSVSQHMGLANLIRFSVGHSSGTSFAAFSENTS
jgi:triacylglycerol esterase/lipase EstA (alpha/beta hydrolase family)